MKIMKKILSILLALTLAIPLMADFEGFPLASNYTWEQCRSVGPIRQLWEAVQERCQVLVYDGIYPLDIVENWQVQDGYTISVVERTYGANTVYVTNKSPHYITVETTNQVGDLTIAISNQPYGNFIPLSTNNINPTTNITLKLPVTHEFMSALDSRIFEITPYFVNMNRAGIDGTFNAYFRNGGDYTNMRTSWPYHCVASVMSNANIGYITNLVYDQWGDITAGNAWFTRQPATTNAWALWQAVRTTEDSVLVSGMTDAAVNGTYVKMLLGDDRLDGWWPDNYYTELEINTNEPIYMKLDLSSVITSKKYSFQWPITTPQSYLWCIDKLTGVGTTTYSYLTNSWKTVKITSTYGPTLANINPGATNTLEHTGEVYTWRDMTSTLITSNYWRNIAPWSRYWFNVETYFDGEWTYNIDSFDNHPAIVGASVIATLTTNWVCRPLANYDVRYYDEGPRPFYRVKINGTNSVNLNVNLQGSSFLRLDEPDLHGQQVVSFTSESKTLTETNTPSNYRWFSVDVSTNTFVTGEAPPGSVVTLMWTNSHSFDALPYRLEVKDLDERCAYLRQLVWTTTPYTWNRKSVFTSYTNTTAYDYRVDVVGYFFSADHNRWADAASWNSYKSNFIEGTRAGWNTGIWAGYIDPALPISEYVGYPDFTNVVSEVRDDNYPPSLAGDVHTLLDRESRAYWREAAHLYSYGSSWPYHDNIIFMQTDPDSSFLEWAGYGFGGWRTSGETPQGWFWDMTDILVEDYNHDTYHVSGNDPGIPYFTLVKEQSYAMTGSVSSMSTYAIYTGVTHTVQHYIGVMDPNIYTPYYMFDSTSGIRIAHTSTPYTIPLTNVVLPGGWFSYTNHSVIEPIKWDKALAVDEVQVPPNWFWWQLEFYPKGVCYFSENVEWCIYSNEVIKTAGIAYSNVVTTNDVVIRWFHGTEDPYVLESNNYYSALSPFYWSNGTTKVEYTTNIFDVYWNTNHVGWNSQGDEFPNYWANYPDNLYQDTWYEYGIRTNITTYYVTSSPVVVTSGFQEWSSRTAITNSEGSWIHTTNDYLAAQSFYMGEAATNRLNDLALGSFSTNVLIATNKYVQTTVLTNTYSFLVKLTGGFKTIGQRNGWAEEADQLQEQNLTLAVTATAPKCLIKWDFSRK